MVDKKQVEKYPPGSKAAIAAGCPCPVIDNRHVWGPGRYGEDGKPLDWIVDYCPIHTWNNATK